MGIPKILLVAVAGGLGLCALGGFALGLTSVTSRHVAAASEEEAPIAANLPANVTIKDAQALAPPPPPPPPVAKPKAAAAEDADSEAAPAEGAASPPAPPSEAAPGAPPSLAAPRPAAPLPADLPPT